MSQAVASPQRRGSLVGTNSQKSDVITQKNISRNADYELKVSELDIPEFAIETSQVTQNWPSVTPLRETHISNKNTDIISDNSWIDPLSQTYIVPNSETTDVKIPTKEKPRNIEEEEDFDDFQTAPVQLAMQKSEAFPTKTSAVDVQIENVNESLDTLTLNKPSKNNLSDVNIKKPSFSNSLSHECFNIVKDSKSTHIKNSSQSIVEDDDFTDFQSSVPTLQSRSPLTSSLVSSLPLEPLRPVPVYQQPYEPTPTQINWPDPGVNEDEIKKFEQIFSTSSLPKVEESPKFDHKASRQESRDTTLHHSDNIWSDLSISRNNSEGSKKTDLLKYNSITSIDKSSNSQLKRQTKEANKQDNSNDIWSNFVRPITINNIHPLQKLESNRRNPSMEDDDWSDFVSAQKPSPVHKIAIREMERTSSPDLPLSVFNLGSIQPTKQPIPVITPHGLVQTKLSSAVANTSPKLQHKTSKQFFQPFHPVPSITPSIISNQYVSQAYSMNSKMADQHSNSIQGMLKSLEYLLFILAISLDQTRL